MKGIREDLLVVVNSPLKQAIMKLSTVAAALLDSSLAESGGSLGAVGTVTGAAFSFTLPVCSSEGGAPE